MQIIYSYNMTRLTIVLDDNLEKRLRGIQAKEISNTGSSYSFSACDNDVLKRGLTQ